MPGVITPSAGARRDAVRTSGCDLWATADFSWENNAKNRPISVVPPWDYPPMIARRSKGDPGVICRQPRQGKSPNGDRTATCRRPPGDRWTR